MCVHESTCKPSTGGQREDQEGFRGSDFGPHAWQGALFQLSHLPNPSPDHVFSFYVYLQFLSVEHLLLLGAQALQSQRLVHRRKEQACTAIPLQHTGAAGRVKGSNLTLTLSLFPQLVALQTLASKALAS